MSLHQWGCKSPLLTRLHSFKKNFAFFHFLITSVYIFIPLPPSRWSPHKKNTDILLEVFLMTPLIWVLNKNFWHTANNLCIQFLLSARGLFRLVQRSCMNSSRNFHGLLDSKETKHPSTFPLLLVFRGEAVMWCCLCAVLDLARPQWLQA